MSSNNPSSDLDSRIAAIVESSVGRMRDELLHRMEDTEARLRDITGRMGEFVHLGHILLRQLEQRLNAGLAICLAA